MKERGFTLMEMLVALAVFAALAAALGGTLKSGVESWRRGRRAADLRQQARVSLEGLARELRNAVPAPGAGLKGGEKDLAFYTARGAELLKVSYRPAAGPRGIPVLGRAESAPGAQEETARPLTSVPTEISFAFAYAPARPGEGPRWEPRWPGGDEPPAGVRARLTLTDPSDGQTWAWEKTCDVPGGVLKEWKP